MAPSVDGVVRPDADDAEAAMCHIVTPVGMIGYGFDEAVVDAELARLVATGVPTAIVCDSGSTDSGPAKLALGSMTAPRSSYKRDLGKMLALVVKHHAPLLFSSAGGDGSNDHVDEMHAVIEEIVAEKGHGQLKVLSIYTEVPKSLVRQKLADGKIQGYVCGPVPPARGLLTDRCGPFVPPLTADDVDAAPRICSQAGCEPFLDALFGAPDFGVLIGGRAYDPSPYVAYAAYQAMVRTKQGRVPVASLGESVLGGFFHMGKIMECGGLCATPKSRSSAATVYRDGSFAIRALDPGSRCTPLTVAAHTLYEKARPDLLYGPGGCLDLTASQYEQMADGTSVRVRGAAFKAAAPGRYTVKLEAARSVGFRTLFMGGMVDPVLNAQLDAYLDRVRAFVADQHRGVDPADWKLGIHKYASGPRGNGVFLVGEALAPTQLLANSIASAARIACVHGPYPGQKATSGNLAMGIGGLLEIPVGPCAAFCIYHLMEIADGAEGAAADGLYTWTESLVGVVATAPGTGAAATPVVSRPPAAKKQHAPVGVQAAPVLPSDIRTLGDTAGIIRSKNSGPYEITFDILFPSQAVYDLVRDSGLLSEDTVARLFHVAKTDICYCGFFAQALAFKATIARLRDGVRAASGGFMEDDVHGSQQYLPLMDLPLPDDLRAAVQAAVKAESL